MKFRDTFSLAFRTVRGNKLRTALTVAIIAFGIMALVGIRTAITAMEQKFVESFSSMGATGFTVRYKEPRFRFGGQELKKEKKGEKKEKKSNIGKPITRQQAEAFKDNFHFPAQVSLTMFGSNDAVISYGGKKSNPNTRIYGGDDNWIDQNGFSLAYGRNINALDVQTGRNVCLIGSDVARKFFNDDLESPIDRIIKINNIPFRIVGTLNAKGTTLGMNWDNAVMTSYTNVRRFFNSNPNASFNIQVKVADIKLMDAATGQATATFRPIRKLTTTEDDNFAIDKSDSFAEMLIGLLSTISLSALIIGFITLLGAAIGLTNIMLVAVTERTKEIGLVKAIGGKSANIRWQFLFESTIISLFGAFFGIILGVLVGNLFSIYLNTGFVVPWGWTVIGIIICTVVGLLAGLYPARKASKLNPIEALRYE